MGNMVQPDPRPAAGNPPGLLTDLAVGPCAPDERCVIAASRYEL